MSASNCWVTFRTSVSSDNVRQGAHENRGTMPPCLASVRMCHLVQIATVHSVAEASEACRIVFESWQGLPQHPQLTNACLGFGI